MENNNLFTATTFQPLTIDEANEVLTTALEGGIGYWAILCNDRQEWKQTSKELKAEKKETPYYSDIALRMLQKGLKVTFEDAEEEDEFYELTLDKFIDGMIQFEKETGISIKHRIVHGDLDADDADVIIQYALFNEIVFG